MAKHRWRLTDEGEIDMLALDEGIHSGPFCEECLTSYCVWCYEDWESTSCE